MIAYESYDTMAFVHVKNGKLDFDVVVIGCGLTGCVLAERLADQGKKVLIIEKRNHIAGNCYDYTDKDTDILMNKYGAHLFHTNSEIVWKYINQFSKWIRWEHKVVASIDNKYVSVPVNITTVNELCGTHMRVSEEMEKWLKENQYQYDVIENSEQMALSKVGNTLYNKLFKPYTIKQWAKEPNELSPVILERIPVRKNFDTRYFDDKYQVLPEKGYTNFISSIIHSDNIAVCLNTDYSNVSIQIQNAKEILTIYTGPIDSYFHNYGLPKLEYRSLSFNIETIYNTYYYQPNSVVNFPSEDVPFTRIVEYKHFLKQDSPHTIIVKEISTSNGEPYYPVLNYKNCSLYEMYRELALKETNVVFAGRLADFKYYNMDQAILNALNVFSEIQETSQKKLHKK